MNWLNKLERKFGRYAIPNLIVYLIGVYSVGFVLNMVAPNILGYLNFQPYYILHGQIWRIFTWLLIPPGGFDLFTLVMLYCYFSIGTLLERTWGTFRYNVFMFMGIIFTIIGAVILYVFIWIFGQSLGAGILEGA